MHTTVTCPPAEISIWRSRLDEDIPAALAVIYRRTAELIREHRVRSLARRLFGTDRPAQHLQRQPVHDVMRILAADGCEKISVITENSGQAVEAASDLVRALGVTPGREEP